MENEMVLMKEYSNNIIERYIYIDDRKMTENEKDLFVSKINRELSLAIQETNAYVRGRTLPYIVVRRIIKDQSRIRVIISEDNIADYDPINEFARIKDLDIENVSHIISFKRLEPQNIIRVGDALQPGTAEVWTNQTNQIAAAVDIFLDIAMFNSISYFREELTVAEKQAFNLTKLEFFRKNDLDSYFVIDETAPPSYISFSFAFRENPKKIDYSGYVNCWEDFLESIYITEKFPNLTIKIDNPEEQLRKHTNPSQIPNTYYTKKFWAAFPKGDYLVLRIHSLPSTYERESRIKHYFGVSQCHVGPIRIVPISEYFRPDVRQDINEGNISAFKIVI